MRIRYLCILFSGQSVSYSDDVLDLLNFLLVGEAPLFVALQTHLPTIEIRPGQAFDFLAGHHRCSMGCARPPKKVSPDLVP